MTTIEISDTTVENPSGKRVVPTLKSIAPDRRKHNNISTNFWVKLSAHPYFQNQQELILPCWRLVMKVYRKSLHYWEDSVEIYHKKLENIFKDYPVSYTEVREVLRSMGVIEFGRSYVVGKKSKEYSISDEMRQFCEQDTENYVMSVHRDKKVKRRAAKAKTMRKSRCCSKNDIVVDTNFKNIHALKYNPADFEFVVNKVANDPSVNPELDADGRARAAANVRLSIRRLIEGDCDVRRYDADGRLHNVYNGMHELMRNCLFMEEKNGPRLVNRFNIDFRAMHPTFLGIYLSKIAEIEDLNYRQKFPTSFLRNTTTNPSLDYQSTYDTNPPNANTTNCPRKRGHLTHVHNVDTLAVEVERWNTLWTNPDNDPRKMLADLFGKDKQWVKDRMLVDMNESRSYDTPFKIWMRQEFPAMWGTWRNTDVSQTGCNLSKFYESALLRTPEFYQFAESIPGIRVLCCHDGVSVFASEYDVDAGIKADKLREFLEYQTFKKFGIVPVIKVDVVERPNWESN